MDRMTLIFSFCCMLCFMSLGLAAWTGWQIARFEKRLDEIEGRLEHEIRARVLDLPEKGRR